MTNEGTGIFRVLMRMEYNIFYRIFRNQIILRFPRLLSFPGISPGRNARKFNPQGLSWLKRWGVRDNH